MKRLHDLKPPTPALAYLWYVAYQRRRGARHLLRVPILELDPHRMRAPYRHDYEPHYTIWRNGIVARGENMVVPGTVMPTLAEQWCNRTQAVNHWAIEQSNPRPEYGRPRGYCEPCWNAYITPAIQSLTHSLRYAQRAQALMPNDSLTGVEEWRRNAPLRFYAR